MCKNKNKNKVQRKLEIGKLLNIIQTIDQYIFRDLETLDKVPKYSVSSFFFHFQKYGLSFNFGLGDNKEY